MRKKSIVTALCLVALRGTRTVTSDGTATSMDGPIQRFDLAIGGYKYGELTVNTETDKVFANAYVGKKLANKKVTLVARKDKSSPYTLDIAQSIVHSDGQVVWKDSLTLAQLDWIHNYGDCAVFFVRIS
jgi:hypothetical protein